jgi:hypothetical protein
MATKEYDLVTIGAGSGGVRASRFAAQYYNAKVAVVELPFGFVSSNNIGGVLILQWLWISNLSPLMLPGTHTSFKVLLNAAAGQIPHSLRLLVAQHTTWQAAVLHSQQHAHNRSFGATVMCCVSALRSSGAGGTCVIRGCVPKKLLVYGAMFNEEFNDAIGFGWMTQRPPHDWKCKSHPAAAAAAAAITPVPVAAGA